VRLDDFYREVDDPHLPRSPLGIPDWDHIDSWDLHAAVAALRTLVDTGSAVVPIYDIGASRVTGRQVVTCAPNDFVLAEGLFAARLTEPLEAEGLLADALCVRRSRWVTFVLRLVRDLAERRKPPHILLRRGIALFRAEPAILAQAEAHGARCVTPREAESQVSGFVTGGSRP
jgi:uridine kinase